MKDRINMLKEGLKEMGKNSEEICNLMVQEMGKPFLEAQGEIEAAVNKGCVL